jgi:hypothetical protein
MVVKSPVRHPRLPAKASRDDVDVVSDVEEEGIGVEDLVVVS